MTIQSERCSSTSVEITSPSGLIPSVLSQETPCGTYKAPWLINAPQGQTIRITLLDYSLVPLDNTVQSPSNAICVAYASIRERGVRTPFTVCGGREREQEVYRSQSNVVEIIVQGAQQKYRRYFLIKYTCRYITSPVKSKTSQVKYVYYNKLIIIHRMAQRLQPIWVEPTPQWLPRSNEQQWCQEWTIRFISISHISQTEKFSYCLAVTGYIEVAFKVSSDRQDSHPDDLSVSVYVC